MAEYDACNMSDPENDVNTVTAEIIKQLSDREAAGLKLEDIPKVVAETIKQLSEAAGLKLDEQDIPKVVAVYNCKRSKSLRLMGCGLTGVGKSTLLNGISKSNFEVGDTLQHQTTRIDKHEKTDGVHTLIVYDTPGFNDSSGRVDNYIKIIKDKCPDVDILLYCIRVDISINVKDNMATLKELKKIINKEVWSNWIIVLTIANRIVTRLQQKTKKGNVAAEFKKDIDLKEHEIRQLLSKVGFSSEEMPKFIIPAGRDKEPSLLNDSNYWLSDLFFAVYGVSSPDGQAVLIAINKDRIKSELDVKPFDFNDKKLEKQPIVLDKNLNYVNYIGGGGVAGVTGASIGAVIVFFAASGVGLTVGAIVGGGAAVGMLITKAVIEVKKAKEGRRQKYTDNIIFV